MAHITSVHAVELRDGVDGGRGDRELIAHDPDRMLPTASSAKVLVLLAAAIAMERGELDPAERLDRDDVAPVGDSGLWQHLAQRDLAADDVARLIGTVSDNLATNVLIARLGGIDAVTRSAAERGVTGIRLHDIVRDARGPDHPATLSTGSARAYTALYARLWRDELGGPAVDARVRGWLRDGVDTSMVAAAFGLDPLAHAAPDRQVALWHKTGSDTGVRADSGIVAVGERVAVWSCLVQWRPSEGDPERAGVLAGMRAIGDEILRALRQDARDTIAP